MIEIRPFKGDEAESYFALRVQALQTNPEAFGEPLESWLQRPLDEVRERLVGSAENFSMGAFDGNLAVGTIGFRRFPNYKQRHIGHLWGVFVSPAYRRQKIGAKLLDATIARAKQQKNLEQISLSVVHVNQAAYSLYESRGFITYGTAPKAQKQADNSYLDEIMMALPIS